MYEPEETFLMIIDISMAEVILSFVGFALVFISWISFRLRLPKKIPRKMKTERAIAVNRLFKPIIIITPLLILLGHLEMALPGLIMLMKAGGNRFPYWIPKVGEISLAADSYSNEIVAVKAELVYDEAGKKRPQMQFIENNTSGFFMSRTRSRKAIIANEGIEVRNAKIRADARKRALLVEESVSAYRRKIISALLTSYVFLSVFYSIALYFIPRTLISFGLFTNVIEEPIGWIQLLFVNYFAYGIVLVFLYLAYFSASNGIELLRISAINSPKYTNINSKPKSLRERFSKKIINTQPIRGAPQVLHHPNPMIREVPITRSALPKVSSLPIPSPPALTPVMAKQPLPPPAPPLTPVMAKQPLPPPAPPLTPVMAKQPLPPPAPPLTPVIAKQPPPPVIPATGLPPGWTIEQWHHYGHQWLSQQVENHRPVN